MRLLDYDSVPVREIVPGFHGRFIHSERLTHARVDITEGARLPEHSHPHEQWTMVLAGTLELTIGGTAHLLTPGKVMYIAPHEPHAARAVSGCQVLDVFQPPRDDYR